MKKAQWKQIGLMLEQEILFEQQLQKQQKTLDKEESRYAQWVAQQDSLRQERQERKQEKIRKIQQIQDAE